MGKIVRISGPLIIAEDMENVKIHEIVMVGEEELFGEVVSIKDDESSIQVYEETSGLKPGDNIRRTGELFKVELGPGLVTNFFDGIQRPLRESDKFFEKGVKLNPLDREKKWLFKPNPSLKKGSKITGGQVLGTVKETPAVIHKILVPPRISGVLKNIKSEGEYTVEEKIAILEDGRELKMYHDWPVRKPRPVKNRITPEKVFLTGQRVLDFFFPVVQGGSIAIPGGFGSGKTKLLFQTLKWCNADVLVYTGCGERGNEVISILEELKKLISRGELLDKRTIYVVNTSNMPVAARTGGIFLAITIAEYFRDQGMNVALLADSLTRWAEAMRELSNRMGEFPGEGGFPTYMSSELGRFFERSGHVKNLNNSEGSVTVMGSVSLYGNDFSDPVAQASMKVAGGLWALDSNLAYKRHYPAINFDMSYSKYLDIVKKVYEKNFDWKRYYDKFLEITGKVKDLEKLTSVISYELLPKKDVFLLKFYELFNELFLKQSANNIQDAHRTIKEQAKLADVLIKYYERGMEALEEEAGIDLVVRDEIFSEFIKLKNLTKSEYYEKIKKIENDLIVFTEEEE